MKLQTRILIVQDDGTEVVRSDTETVIDPGLVIEHASVLAQYVVKAGDVVLRYVLEAIDAASEADDAAHPPTGHP